MQQSDLNQENSEPRIIDIEVLLSLLFLGKKTILFTTAACLLAALGFLMVSPSRYEATVKVLAEPDKERNPLAVELRSYQEWRTFIETQKEMVISDSVLRETIAIVQDKKVDEITKKELTAFSKQVEVRSRSSLGASLFSGDGIGESNTFFIIAHSNNPEVAALIANTMVEQYKITYQRVRMDQAGNALQVMEDIVEATSKKTKESHNRLIEFEKKAGILLPELMNIDKPTLRIFPELEDLRSDYELKNIDVYRRKALVKALEDSIKEKNLDIAISGTVIPTNATINQLRNRKTQLKIELVKTSPFFLENSREIQNLKQQIKELDKAFEGVILSHLVSEKKALEILISEQTARKAALNSYQKKLEELGILNSHHVEFKREYQSLANVLNSQMERLAEAEASVHNSISGANIAVVDKAYAPTSPMSQHPLRTLFLALIVGFGIGLVVVLSNQAFRPVFVHPRQLAKFSGVPVTAVRND